MDDRLLEIMLDLLDATQAPRAGRSMAPARHPAPGLQPPAANPFAAWISGRDAAARALAPGRSPGVSRGPGMPAGRAA